MKDQIEIGDLRGSHKIWRCVAVGAIVLACLMFGLAYISPNPTACVVVAVVCLILSGGMFFLLHFMDHTLLLTPEGMCWISQARQKVTPWSQVAGARVDTPSHSSSGDYRPRLYIDCIDGSTYCEARLRFLNQETADVINKMKEVYGCSNKSIQATPEGAPD